jgi:hypothetical protein
MSTTRPKESKARQLFVPKTDPDLHSYLSTFSKQLIRNRIQGRPSHRLIGIASAFALLKSIFIEVDMDMDSLANLRPSAGFAAVVLRLTMRATRFRLQHRRLRGKAG